MEWGKCLCVEALCVLGGVDVHVGVGVVGLLFSCVVLLSCSVCRDRFDVC